MTVGSAGNAAIVIAMAAAKYAVLLPTVVLLPTSGWRRFRRLYRPEWAAAVVALFTLFPYRVFKMAWPWYSQALGNCAYALASPFVSGLKYKAFPAPTILGPAMDVTVDFSCGGLGGVELFQVLFIIMIVLDWRALNRVRALAGYCCGLLMMLAANALRIALLVALGNRFSPDPVVHYHVFAGWIFSALVFTVYLLMMYQWLLTRSHSGSALARA
jgi:exosortase/archaeosortase family protein